MKIQGIRSVDFKVQAEGEGIVNWNGGFRLRNPEAGQFVDNHVLPKMRNVDPMRIQDLCSKEFAKAKIFVSQNCIRHHLFSSESSNLTSVNVANINRVLTSILGLVRGYVIADKTLGLSLKRKSSLLLEDFVAPNSTVRFEQFGNAGERNETSIFSKTEADHLSYLAYGSISIEDLQFIILEDSFNRSGYQEIISLQEGQDLAQEMTEFLKTLDFDNKFSPVAIFHPNYVRKGGFMKKGEAGLLLNDDALDLIVQEMLTRLQDLFVRQSKGYLRVTNLLIDYNDGRPLRIKDDETSINSSKNNGYAVYFSPEDMTEADFNQKMKELKEFKKQQKKKNKDKNKRPAKDSDLVQLSVDPAVPDPAETAGVSDPLALTSL